jgi:very-short-patch-repair endonuclease
VKKGDSFELHPQEIVRALNSILGAHSHPWQRVLVALGELIHRHRQPVLVVFPPTEWKAEDALAWLETGVRLLADLAMKQPLLSLFLVLEPDLFQAYLESTGDSRAKALARESVVRLATNSLVHTDLPDAGQSSGSSELSQSISQLAAAGASAELIKLCETAYQAEADLSSSHSECAEEEHARSAAERFLFERLQTLPQTAGLFRLNQTLGFRFGPYRDIEVDICAQSLNLVIEVDGYYHFRDPESYRRDRRKDLELQKNGYLVFRVLAEDVVSRLEDVLATIVGAVELRRTRIETS